MNISSLSTFAVSILGLKAITAQARPIASPHHGVEGDCRDASAPAPFDDCARDSNHAPMGQQIGLRVPHAPLHPPFEKNHGSVPEARSDMSCYVNYEKFQSAGTLPQLGVQMRPGWRPLNVFTQGFHTYVAIEECRPGAKAPHDGVESMRSDDA